MTRLVFLFPIRMMKSQRSDNEKNNLTEECKRKGIDEITRQNA